MKSLFHRKASITSSSGSSFSNASHYSQNSLALSNHVASGSSKQHLQGTTMTSTRQPPSRRAISPETSRDPPESEMDQDNDIITDNCPVCVEDLKMKLMGEKPLVIPKCGHRLHASCFEAVYGSLEEARRTGDVLGLCGICRKDMRLNASGGGSFPAKTLDRSRVDHHLIRKSSRSMLKPASGTANHKIHSITRKTLVATPWDMLDDESDCEDEAQLSELELEREDELLGPAHELDLSSESHQPSLLHPGGIESLRIECKRQQTGKGRITVKPIVTVLAENSNLFLNKDSDKSQHLTCMVTIELPSLYAARPNSSQPAPQLSSPSYATPLSRTNSVPKPSPDISSHPNSSSLPGCQLTYQSSSASPMSPPPSAAGQFSRASSQGASARSALLSLSTRQHPESPGEKTCQVLDRHGALKPPFSREGSINFISPLLVHHDHLPPLPLEGPPTQPLQSVLDDLHNRLQDWKGHSSKDFGILKKYDRIYVEKQANCRQFLVYLFEEALLCVAPVCRDSIIDLGTQQDDNSVGRALGDCPLKLKGRVYMRHMDSVSVIDHDPKVKFLRVKMKDEKMDAFTMRFHNKNQLEDWYSTIGSLIEKRQLGSVPPPLKSPMRLPEVDRSHAEYIPSTPLSLPPTPGLSHPVGPILDREALPIAGNSARSSRSDSFQSASDPRSNDGGSSIMTGSTRTNLVTSMSTLTSVGEESAEVTSGKQDVPPSHGFAYRDLSVQNNVAFRSASLRHDFRPIDLVLVISIPFPEPAGSPRSSPSSLKLRLLKQSLQFLVYHLHPRSRLSLVAFTVGSSSNVSYPGQLLYTPFLTVGKASSLKRVEFAIEQISRAGRTEGILTAQNWKYFGEDIAVLQRASDPAGYGSAAEQANWSYTEEKVLSRLRMLEKREEKVSVVTAVNLAYDMILPRKQKNPLSGIMLLNDSRDCSTKPEMALVMARAEAIQIPIQSIGWGETHNPTSLWQLSNHTGGTYTFVREHNSIKDAIAGCIGGMLSVGMSNARVKINIGEKKWFKMKKVSGISHVISSDGQHADLEIGQLRFGERRDVLVEVEMKSARELYKNQSRQATDGDQALLGVHHQHNQIETGTDAFFRNQLGVDLSVGSIGDTDPFARFYEAQFDEMNDDIPLFEVNVSYRDTQAGKNVAKLPRPAVLMVTVTPTLVDSPGSFTVNEPSIVQRRVELLTSDSLSRVLLLVSRRMDRQGLRLMNETRRIVSTLMSNLFQLDSYTDHSELIGRRAFAVMEQQIRRGQMKTTSENIGVFVMLAGCLQVLQRMIEGLEKIERGLHDVLRHVEAQYPVPQPGASLPSLALRTQEDMRNQVYLRFEKSMKNFAAEQSGILRDQKAWLIHSIDSTVQSKVLPSHPSTPSSTHQNFLQQQQEQHVRLDDSNLSIIEEIYFRSDYSIWMKNMMEYWMPERY
ncbi:hypothetical protein PCASD_16137 [Puccinia coronata f. sp. avenae]|uniref:RING-type domain-containing protein n=1 Tax=Puccinia coronata f. sp. avenae TaxID=200324 RepID=A0A2N5TAL5_9BASI|nr:hypothetical protein PCASD_16137 [Puccinia coronata f. sp. avenae]